jgi:pyruvate kinase
MPLPIHRTKILCTFGPAIGSTEKIKLLLKAGATAFRLNMSHGSHDVHAESVKLIREVEAEVQTPIPIIADIQGPKLRVGDLPNDGKVSIINGTEALFADERIWEKRGKPDTIIPVRYATIATDVKKGDVILFDDGLLKVIVLSTDGEVITTIVENGGILKSRKGLNLPNVPYSDSILTEKDKRDIVFAIQQKADFIALSFVRDAKDIAEARAFITANGGDVWIISKIEKPEAVKNLDEIIEVSDAIMVARGDLGVEMSAAEVPIVQKQIISKCNRRAKPVITATQMLESMIQNPRPTRAEASDVANAVFDGTDCVMLSAETSVGAYPVETVSYMRTICTEAEKEFVARHTHIGFMSEQDSILSQLPDTYADAIAGAVSRVSREMYLDGIVTMSMSGKAAAYISSHRLTTPIIAVSEHHPSVRRMQLMWGVQALHFPMQESTDQAIENVKQLIVERGFLKKNSTVVVTVGRPLSKRPRTNMLCIEVL